MITGKIAMLGVVLLAFISPCLGVTVSHTVTYKQTEPPVELVCTDAADSVKLKWFYNGTDVTSRKDWAKEFTNFETNKTLRLLKVEPTTVGPLYSCLYENGSIVMNFSLKAKPYIKPFEKAKNIIQGDPLRLDCNAWSVPAPEISWFRNNTIRILPDGTRITLKNNSATAQAGFPVLDNSTLRIEQLDYPEAGNYTCFATVMIGDEKFETNATVLVQVKNKYAALWPFLGICAEVAILCTIIIIYEKRRAKRIAEEERQEEAERLNAPSDTKTPASDDVRQRK